MKNHRFLWLRNRTTDNRKCEKARNIKEKRTIEMFSTVSKQLVALRSSASDNYEILSHTIKNSKTQKVIPSGSFFNQYARLAYDLAKVWRRINMKLLFGTGNQAKLNVMKIRLKPLGINLIGLEDLKKEGYTVPSVPETGNTPLENARQKAMAYYQVFKMPVFSCDSGLYFDEVPDEIQPGVHVRNVNGRCLSDDEMIAYYTGLAKQYGNLTAYYQNAICLVMDETQIFETMDPSIASEPFLLTDTPHSKIRKAGFPLDCISLDLKAGKYYYDMPKEELEQLAVEDGVLAFFEGVRSHGDRNVGF